METRSSSFAPSLLVVSLLLAFTMILAACSGGGGVASYDGGSSTQTSSDSSSSDSTTTSPNTMVTGGIAVDPYLVGATFFEDVNGNGRWDQGEQISSPSDEQGRFNFTNPVTPGRNIIMLERGLHQGVPFTGRLMRRVEAGDTATVVVSPLTTYTAIGQDPGNLAAPLRYLNDSYTSDYDITADPMAGLATITTYRTADHEAIANLRANLYIGAVLDLALLQQDLSEISVQDFQSKLVYWNPLPDFISGLRYAVSAEAINRISAELPAGVSDLPPVSMREVAETMPAIINWWKQELIRKAIENQDLIITWVEIKALVDRVQGELGLHYYLRNHRNHQAVQREISARRLPSAGDGHALVKANGTVGPVQSAAWQDELSGLALALGNSSRLRFFPAGQDSLGATELTYRGNNGETAIIAGTWRVENNLLILADNHTDARLSLELETNWSSHLSLRIKGDPPLDLPPTSLVGKLLEEARRFSLAEG